MSSTDQAAGDDTEATDNVTAVTILVSSTSVSGSLQCCLNRGELNGVNKPAPLTSVPIIISLCLEKSEKSSYCILTNRGFLIAERPYFILFVFL